MDQSTKSRISKQLNIAAPSSKATSRNKIGSPPKSYPMIGRRERSTKPFGLTQ